MIVLISKNKIQFLIFLKKKWHHVKNTAVFHVSFDFQYVLFTRVDDSSKYFNFLITINKSNVKSNVKIESSLPTISNRKHKTQNTKQE